MLHQDHRTDNNTSKSERACILVVDDDPKIRMVLQYVIQSAGLKVIVAENGADALAILRSSEHKVDLMVLDLMMPVLSGPAALAEIRELGLNPRVVICSGSTTDAEATSTEYPDLVQAVISKPFALDKVVSAVKKALAQGTPSDQASQPAA